MPSLMLKKIFVLFAHLSFSFLALVLMVALFELTLRITCPKYKYAAESQLIISQSRIYLNPKNLKSYRQHPDSNETHLVIHNSLGFRQHREFSGSKGTDVIRVGFFGDSFTENLRMEVQYSFTEVLDYLLNETGKKFEIMNFGTDGYSTAQSYLQYLQEGRRSGLDSMFYIYCNNDLGGMMASNLLRIDQKGDVVSSQYKESEFINFVNKLYVTYFFWEHSNDSTGQIARIQKALLKKEWKDGPYGLSTLVLGSDFSHGIITEDVKKALRLFHAIILKWKQSCEAQNTRFYIVTLPFRSEDAMNDFLKRKGFAPVSLYDEFKQIDQDLQSYRFENDGHWNEEANKVAAVFLFKFLAKQLSINYGGDEFIEQSLYQYYSSFPTREVTDYLVKKHHDFSPKVGESITAKYLSLEQPDRIKDLQ